MYKVLLFLTLVVAALAQSGHHHEEKHHDHHHEKHHDHHHHEDHFIDYHAHPKYKFEYDVEDKHTHDHHKQEETRDGDKVTGYYSLHEPDGTLRIVHYTADKKTGFNAHVERKGKATHPQHYGSTDTYFKHHDDHHH